jgi:hypothetical protein
MVRDIQIAERNTPDPVRQHNKRVIPMMKKSFLLDGIIQNLTRNTVSVEHLIGLSFLKYTIMM